jgi:hypothetical protein
MKILIVKIIFLILLELVLSRGAFGDDSNNNIDDEDDIDKKNQISVDIEDVMKVIGSVFSKKFDEDGEIEKDLFQFIFLCTSSLRG